MARTNFAVSGASSLALNTDIPITYGMNSRRLGLISSVSISVGSRFELRGVNPQELIDSLSSNGSSGPSQDESVAPIVSIQLTEIFGYRGRCAIAEVDAPEHPRQGR